MLRIYKVSEINSMATIFNFPKNEGHLNKWSDRYNIKNKFRERIELSGETLWSLKGLELT